MIQSNGYSCQPGRHSRSFLAAMIAGLALSGCSDYEVKFNERSVYTPEPLYSDYRLADAALNDCVRQTIKDKRVTAVKDLTLLVCSNAGITSLDGLARFTHLEQVNLADNELVQIDELGRLPRLTRVDLSNNALVDSTPLMTLANLKQVSLRGNPALDCAQAAQVEANSNAKLALPEHCN